MNFQEHATPEKLERYSFLWSEARLVIAAIALAIGGVPPILYLGGISSIAFLANILRLCWIISGAASGYLLYRWVKNNKIVFGGNNQKDMIWFLVSVVSGLNLGITGLFLKNIGMSISSGFNYRNIVFFLATALYLAAATYLYKKWKSYGEKLF